MGRRPPKIILSPFVNRANMRFVLVALLAGLCAVSAFSVDSTNYTQKQKDIWWLFKYINQPSYYPEHIEIAKTYKFWEHADFYTKPEISDNFWKFWKYGTLLQRGEVFSVFHEEHLKQAVALFKLFYYAKDWDTFYKTAAWARQEVNEGMFLYSLSTALIHRHDTYFIVLPPIYEIYPHYFVGSEIITKAQYYKQMFSGQKEGLYNNVLINANYSGHYLNLQPEQSMSYFTEDVGVNSFYYYYNLYYPFWMDGEEFNLKYDSRSEMVYYMYQQILSRYYLERLSNDFGEIEWFNWDMPLEVGYYPSLVYPNGLEFPSRPKFAKLHEYFYNYGQSWTMKGKYGFSYIYIQNYIRRIMDVVDSGYVLTKQGEKQSLFTEKGIHLLGDLIESNPDSVHHKFYGPFMMFARHLLGYSTQPLDLHRLHPSALEHFETSMRDPAFYMLYKKMLMFFIKYKYNHLQPYTQNELYMKGVTIDKVEFDRLITYFDKYTWDLSNAVYVTPEEYNSDSFKIQVVQDRLNHKPFNYKVTVNSESEQDVVVYVYMGPKYDEYGRIMNLTENWMNWVQFDHFTYKLKAGQNSIMRNSKEIFNYMHDRSTYYEWYQQVFKLHDKTMMRFRSEANMMWFGFPQSFMLPKGSYSGVPLQFFVMVTKMLPYTPLHQTMTMPMVGSGLKHVDGYPMGWPFDRPVYYQWIWDNMPNGYFYETKVYQRMAEDIKTVEH